MRDPDPLSYKAARPQWFPCSLKTGLLLTGLVALLWVCWWKAPNLQHRWYKLTSFAPEQADLQPGHRYVSVMFIGQSNAANHGAWRHSADDPHRAWHAGSFHKVRDPLPGCTGVGGSVGAALALLEPLEAEAWLLACVAYGSTAIADWAPGKGLALAAVQSIEALASLSLGPHWIVVHQGETDALNGTTPAEYEASLRELLGHLLERAPQARILLCNTSVHSKGAAPAQALRAAQERVWRSMSRVWAGVDTDSFPSRLRARDGVHFNAEGLKVFAELLRQAMAAPSETAIRFDVGIAE